MVELRRVMGSCHLRLRAASDRKACMSKACRPEASAKRAGLAMRTPDMGQRRPTTWWLTATSSASPATRRATRCTASAAPSAGRASVATAAAGERRVCCSTHAHPPASAATSTRLLRPRTQSAEMSAASSRAFTPILALLARWATHLDAVVVVVPRDQLDLLAGKVEDALRALHPLHALRGQHRCAPRHGLEQRGRQQVRLRQRPEGVGQRGAAALAAEGGLQGGGRARSGMRRHAGGVLPHAAPGLLAPQHG
ncbi:hypothetical protein APUTEX25_000530, partial [Auxenochlorella protothecoides]